MYLGSFHNYSSTFMFFIELVSSIWLSLKTWLPLNWIILAKSRGAGFQQLSNIGHKNERLEYRPRKREQRSFTDSFHKIVELVNCCIFPIPLILSFKKCL